MITHAPLGLLEESAPSTTLSAGTYLVSHGVHIVPLHGVNEDGTCTCPYQHSEPKEIGKHPRVSDWKTLSLGYTPGDLPKVLAPVCNLGIYARPSNLVVLDIDPRNGGEESFYNLLNFLSGEIPETVEAITGLYKVGQKMERGRHLYFSLDDGEQIVFRKDLKKLGFRGLDIIHEGYVLAAPSKHGTGVNYEWREGREPWNYPIAPLPEGMKELFRAERGKSHYKSQSISTLGDDEWLEKWDNLRQELVTPTPYARATLKAVAKQVRNMKSGERNNTLNAAAYTLGRCIGGGQISFEEAYQTLLQEAQRNYGPEWATKENKVLRVLRVYGGGFESGAMEPKYPVELTQGQIEWASKVSIQFVESDSTEEDSRTALAELMSRGFLDGRGSLKLQTTIEALEMIGPLSVGEDKQIWFYEAGVWSRGGRSEIIRRLNELLGERARPAHIQNVIQFFEARHATLSGIGPKEFINCKNGMLDWKSGFLSPHQPSYGSTYQLDVDWNPNATCPTVDAFLAQVADPDVVELLWEVIGISIFGGLGFQKAIILYGTGRNGKGALLRLISKLIPEALRSNVDLQSLGKDRFASAELHGKIVNICGDIPATALSDTATFKMLTGEDSITAQFKHRDLFTFVNNATLLFSANTLPETPDKTKGFYSRLLIVPFDKVSLEDSDIDSSIEPRMWAELEGVLVKAVEGLKRAMERGGFAPTEACANALAKYIDHRDTVETFLDSAVVAVEGSEIPRSDLYTAYREYCRINRLEPIKSSDFYLRVENSAALSVLTKKNVSGTRLFSGISIKPFVFY